MWAVYLLLVFLYVRAVTSYRVFHLLPLQELKRRARAGDRTANDIYKMASFGDALDLFVFVVGAASGITTMVWATRTAWWAGAAAMLAEAWLIFWLPRPQDGGLWWRLTALVSRVFLFRIVDTLRPILRPLSRFLPKTEPPAAQPVYEREDLLDLLRRQNRSRHNRIPEQELKMALSALVFADKKVADAMTPRAKVRFVAENEVVGPALMDELFNTGFKRFPVVKGSAKTATPQITGTLYLSALLDHLEQGGKVADIAKKHVSFINESSDLHQALDAIQKNEHHLLIVINNFEEVIGVLTFEDVVAQILGEKIFEEFDRYGDMHAVAKLTAEKEEKHDEPIVKNA